MKFSKSFKANFNIKARFWKIKKKAALSKSSSTTLVGKNVEKYWLSSSLVKFQAYNMQPY